MRGGWLKRRTLVLTRLHLRSDFLVSDTWNPGLVWPSCNDQLHHKLYFWVYPKAIDQGWGGQPCHTAKGEQKFQFTYFNWSWAEFGKFDIFNIDWLILFSVCNSVILFSRLFLIENFEQSVFLISCINSNRTEFDKLGPSWVQLNLGCDQTKECGYFVNTIELMLSWVWLSNL